MSGINLWEQLLRRSCPHRFSWPRVDDNQRHYQICLICGTAYEYNWNLMSRTNRLLVSVSQGKRDRSISGRVIEPLSS
jgi:hypothetical protein